MLNWIVWNRTVWHLNCVLMLNWIVYIYIYIYMDLPLNNLNKVDMPLNQTKPNQTNSFLYEFQYQCLNTGALAWVQYSIRDTKSLALWVKCLPVVQEAGVQSQVKSYQRLKIWYLMPPCLTLSIIRCGSRVKWNNPENGVAASFTP